MALDYEQLHRTWDAWRFIPEHYNLGTALTEGQARRGKGPKLALLWENASGQTCSYTYAQLDALTNRLAFSLSKLGVCRGNRIFFCRLVWNRRIFF